LQRRLGDIPRRKDEQRVGETEITRHRQQKRSPEKQSETGRGEQRKADDQRLLTVADERGEGVMAFLEHPEPLEIETPQPFAIWRALESPCDRLGCRQRAKQSQGANELEHSEFLHGLKHYPGVLSRSLRRENAQLSIAAFRQLRAYVISEGRRGLSTPVKEEPRQAVDLA
jgi:hypothetical protein